MLTHKAKYFFIIFNLFLFFQEVKGQVTPCFSAATTVGCAPFVVVIDDRCSGASSPQYDYGDGTPVTNINIHEYKKAGVYSITQYVNQVGNNPNSLTKTDYITVYEPVIPTFTVDYCTNYNIKLTIGDQTYSNYLVNWGSGGTDSQLAPGASEFHPYSDSSLKTISVKGIYLGSSCGGVMSMQIKPGLDWKVPSLTSVSVSGPELSGNYIALSPIKYKLERKDPVTSAIAEVSEITANPAGAYQLQNVQNNQAWILQLTGFDVCGSNYAATPVSSLHLTGTAQNNENVLNWSPYTTAGFTSFELKRDGQVIYQGLATNYIDKNVICAQEYSYQLTTTLSNGSISTSDVVKLTAFTKDIPPAVTELNADIVGDSLKISWKTPPVDVSNYDLYSVRGNDTTSVKTGFINHNYSIIASQTNLSSCYFVDYTDKCGNLSPLSNSTCPISLQLVSYERDGTTNLAWTPYIGDGFVYDNYVLLLVDGQNSNISEKDMGNVFSYTDSQKDTVNQVKTYKIKAASSSRPTVAYSNEVKVEQPSTFFVPNAFSPNGDGVNDTFKPKGRFVASYKMGVYNRWGELLFSTDDFNVGWDGNIGGTAAPSAIYSYVIEAGDSIGKTYKHKGNVTLIR